MRFALSHRFACSPELLWEITDSQEFEDRLGTLTNSRRTIVERSEREGTIHQRLRIAMRRELPAAMRKVLGSEEIAWDQITHRPLDGDTLHWKIEPMVLKGRFHGEGVTIIRASEGGCERIIEGELSIRVPLVGGRMEEKLVEDVSMTYERAARVIEEMVAARSA